MIPDSIVLHNFKIEREDIKRKVIYHFSDVHLTEYDELSSESEINKAKELTSAWEKVRRDFALYSGEKCEEAQLISAKSHLQSLINASCDGDALVMTGDVIDFIGSANLRAVDSILTDFQKPFISVCGNHEDSNLIPDGIIFSVTKRETQEIDLGDLIIIGIDNSKRKITKAQNDFLLNTLSKGKPIIVAMHIPIMTNGNEALLKKGDEYFYLNNSHADEETLRFIDILKENSSQIVALLSGHLHFGNESEIISDLTQYVASQGILGNLNRYEIGQ